MDCPDEDGWLLAGVNVVVPITLEGLDEPLDTAKLVEFEFNFILVGLLALFTLNFTLLIIAFSFCTLGSKLIDFAKPARFEFFILPFTESFT